ncbi:MAG: hypothetical protein ACI8QC_002315 [Planctomycetota bacterium]|jgi:hypothetical protein
MLSFVLGPLSIGAAISSGSSSRYLVVGRLILLIMVCGAVLGVVAGREKWVHQFWSCSYPLHGMFIGAGFMLQGVWSSDRKFHEELGTTFNGALVVFLGLLFFGIVPIFLQAVSGDAWPVGRVDGSSKALVSELVAIARYGFGGEVPGLLVRESSQAFGGELGYLPRFVGVPLGASYLAALYWVQFALLALMLRVIPRGVARRALMHEGPLVLAVLTFGLGIRRAVWNNSSSLPTSYGPLLLVACVLTLVLFLAIRVDRRRVAERDPHPGPELGACRT